MTDSEREYANIIYNSMYECGQRLVKEEHDKNIWNAALVAAQKKLKEDGYNLAHLSLEGLNKC